MSDPPHTGDTSSGNATPLAGPARGRFEVSVTADTHFGWLRARGFHLAVPLDTSLPVGGDLPQGRQTPIVAVAGILIGIGVFACFAVLPRLL